MKMFKKIAIIGVGLIGGSIGLAAKKRKIAGEVIGICRRKSSLGKALKARAVDNATLDLKEGIKDADLVIIASPVGKITELARNAVRFMKTGAVLTDVGSAKNALVKILEKTAGNKVNFIGSHPMAGSDRSGPENASDDLFENATLILTKTNKTDKKSLSKLKKFWEKLGANIIILSPQKHDKDASLASYLPHVLAFSLALSQDADSLKLAAGSLKDTTRVASSDTDLWADIFLLSRRNVILAIRIFRKNLARLERAVAGNKKKELVKFLNAAKKLRDAIRNGA